MAPHPPLASLGRRIVILGPSNSGKSTLALALAQHLDIPPVHLDLFRHLPNTDWQERPNDEFHALHDAAILEPEWVMDGNYSAIIPQRIARATGIIVIDDGTPARLARYVRRTLFERNRAGGLEGNRDSIKWAMIRWIITRRQSAAKYRELAMTSGLPYVSCASFGEVKALYRAWGLKRPSVSASGVRGE
jgi:adenylate kinase family enzyme